MTRETVQLERPPIGPDECPIARTLSLLGHKWTLLVMREALFGTARFDDFQAKLRIPRPVLSERLALLTEHGLLVREPYRDEGQRSRAAYRLTDKGADLLPVLIALVGWGNRHLSSDAGPTLLVTHRGCGAPVGAELRCEEGHALTAPAGLEVRSGPGARRAGPERSAKASP